MRLAPAASRALASASAGGGGGPRGVAPGPLCLALRGGLGHWPRKPSDSWKTSLEMETPPRDHVRGVVGGLSTAADRASSSCSQGHPSEPRPAVRAVPEPPTREEGRPAPRETQLRAVATTQVLLSIVRDVPHAVPCRANGQPSLGTCRVASFSPVRVGRSPSTSERGPHSGPGHGTSPAPRRGCHPWRHHRPQQRARPAGEASLPGSGQRVALAEPGLHIVQHLLSAALPPRRLESGPCSADTGLARAQGHPAARALRAFLLAGGGGDLKGPLCSGRASRAPAHPATNPGVAPGENQEPAAWQEAPGQAARPDPPHWQLGRTGPPGATPPAPPPGALAPTQTWGFTRPARGAQGPRQVRETEAKALVPPPRSHGNLQRTGLSGAAWGTFPPRPETPTTPRFPASPAARWGPWRHAPASAHPAPADLHPNSALSSGRAEGSALCISQGIPEPVWGYLSCPRPHPPRAVRTVLSQGRQKYLHSLSTCLLSTPLLSWFTHQGCWSAWQTMLPNQLGWRLLQEALLA